jgi:hypothetical protein
MKKYFLFLVAVLLNYLVIAQNHNNKEPFLVKAFGNESIKAAEVKTSGGSISVTAVNAAETKVEVFVYAYSQNGKEDLSKEEIQKRLDELYDLTISVSNNKLTAIAKSKEKINDWKKSLSIAFKVFVPKNVSTDLTTSGGSISLDGISGNQEFTTSGGSLNIENVSGKINGKTSGGSINLSNSTDDIELTTSGGSINAENCEGKLKLTTSGGSLNLRNLKGEINATTSGGSVRGGNIGGELKTHTSGGSIFLNDLSCSLETSTSSGSIHVSMKELGKFINISNSAGNINLELPKDKGLNLDLSAQKIIMDKPENFKGTIDDDEMEGALNGGGIPVKVKTSNGRISLVLK